MTTTIWLLMDFETPLEAFVTEPEALRALRQHQAYRDPQEYVQMKVVAVEVDAEAGRTDWQLRRGHIEQVQGTDLAAERSGVPISGRDYEPRPRGRMGA